MGIPFIPLCAIIAVLIIAFLFASLPQISHKTRYRVLYAITIIMLLAVIPISEYMAGDTPIRERRRELEGKKDYVLEVLHEGNRRANEIANATLDEVREAMHMVY